MKKVNKTLMVFMKEFLAKKIFFENIVLAKYQIAPSKAVVGVDKPMALSMQKL